MAYHYEVMIFNPTKTNPEGTMIHDVRKKGKAKLKTSEIKTYHTQRRQKGLQNADFHVNGGKVTHLTFKLINTTTIFHSTDPFGIKSIAGTPVSPGASVTGVKVKRIADDKIMVTFNASADKGAYEYTLKYDGFEFDPVIDNGTEPNFADP